MAGSQNHGDEHDQPEQENLTVTNFLNRVMIEHPEDYEFYLQGEKIGSDVFKASVIMTAYADDGAVLNKPILAGPFEYYSFAHSSGETRKAFNLGTDQQLLDKLKSHNSDLVSEDEPSIGMVYVNYEVSQLEFPSTGLYLKQFWANTIEQFNLAHARFSAANPQKVFPFNVVWVNAAAIHQRLYDSQNRSFKIELPKNLQLSRMPNRVINQEENNRTFHLALNLRQGNLEVAVPLLRQLKYDAEVKTVFRHLYNFAESHDRGVKEHSRRIESLLIHGYLLVQYNQQANSRSPEYKNFEKYCTDHEHEGFVHRWYLRQRPWLEEKVRPVLDNVLGFIETDEFVLGVNGSRRWICIQTEAGMVKKPIPHGFFRMYELLSKHQPSDDLLKVACSVNKQALKRATLKQSHLTKMFNGNKRVRSPDTAMRYEDVSGVITATAETLGPIGPSVMAYKGK